MGYDISKLPNYTDEQSREFVSKSILGAQTLDILAKAGSLDTSVKGSKAIQLFDVEVVLQDGETDGFSAAGGAILDQRILTVKEIKSNSSFSNRELTQKWTQAVLSDTEKGQNYTDALFSEFIGNEQSAQIAAANEFMVWQGSVALTGATNANKNKFNGFLTQMKADANAINLSGATSGKTNMVDKLVAGFLAVKEEVRTKEDFRIFISTGDYQVYVAELAARNLYVPTADKVLFGTTAKMEVVDGLVGSGTAVYTRLRNLKAGTDLADDAANVKKFFDEMSEKLNHKTRYALGVTIIYPAEIAYAKVN